MKQLLFFLVLVFLAASCVDVKFEQAQPAGKNALKKFPKKLQGIYTDGDNDTLLTINEFSYEYEDEIISLSTDTDLSESNILKKFGRYYLLNIEEDDLWMCFAAELQKKEKLVLYSIDGSKEETVNKLKMLTAVKESKNTDGDVDVYIVNPSRRELKKMLKEGVFSDEEVYYKVR